MMLLLLGAPAAVADTAFATSSAAVPTITGPVTGGNGVPTLSATSFDLAGVGYQQSEFLVAGTATAYAPAAPLTPDGAWRVAPSASAAYVTRAVVYRPIERKKFNGTVVVEWLNVSGGLDAAPDWVMTHNELIRQGYAWVGVSAQKVGVDATKSADPTRYAALSHPGDSFSYDIFSQAGVGVRAHAGLVLGGLKPRRVVAAGESQSAARLVTYVDAVHPLVHVYDGFLVHSRGASGAPLSQAPQATVTTPSPTMIRNDLRQPVFVFETETDVFNSNLGDRQPDTRRFRLWEVPGTSHFDYYGLAIGPNDTGNGQGAVLDLAAMQHPTNMPIPAFSCNLPVNTGGAHWVLDAVVYWLNRWVATGEAPPTAPRIETTGVSPVVFAKDANGNVLGGVRTPHVDAPVAALGGVDNSGSGAIGQFCRLFGTTVPFSDQQLATLYPSHGRFVSRWVRSTRRSVRHGYLLPRDAVELDLAAATSEIGT
jgi:hypothetical protein